MKKFILIVNFLLIFLTISAQNVGSFMSFDIEYQNIEVKNVEEYFPKWFNLDNYITFEKVKEVTDELNTTHTTYQEYFQDIPIEGCVVLVHSKKGIIYCVNGQVADNSKLPSWTKVLITKQHAKNIAQQKTKTLNTSNNPTENVVVKINKKGIINYRLAIKVRVESTVPLMVSDVYIDAETGEVLNEISLINNIDVKATVQTLYKGKQDINCDKTDNIYSLKDNNRNIWTYNAISLNPPSEPPLYTSSTIDWHNPVLTSITITSIESGWWSSLTDSNPDLYIIIKDENDNQVYKSNYYDDTNPTVIFNLPKPIELKNNGYKIEIWDYDITDADDFGGSVNITNINEGEYTWNGTNHTGKLIISDFPHPAFDVHWGMEKTYDFYFSKFGRKSFDGNGAQIIQLVNPPDSLSNTLPNNAFARTDAKFMAYGLGDGLFMKPVVALDIMAHEFTHLVTATNGNDGLEYQAESGALNESFSDIFACGVEFYVNINPNWTIGEDVMIPAPFMRSMSNPKTNLLSFPYEGKTLDNRQPNTYKQEYWQSTTDVTSKNDYGGVHRNSGVQNYWFYLLCQGGSGTNDLGKFYQVSGIGINDALKIAYRNLMTYLTRQATYQDACNGSLQAAIDIFGKNSSQYLSVENAWKAVGVPTPNTMHDVIITQVYGGGGNSGATYKSDFIELYNTSNTDVDISGWTLYYFGATSSTTSNKYEFPSNTIIKAGKHFALKCADGTGTQPAWSITFDGTSTLALGGTSGKVVLLKSNSAFTLSAIPTIEEIVNNANFDDYVPYGTTAVPIWGSVMNSNTSSTMAAKRKFIDGKYLYTKNIGNDFEVAVAEPHNSSMTVDVKTVSDDKLNVFAYNKTLFINGSYINQSIEIYDITGSLVYKSIFNSNAISLSSFSSGIYIVKIGLNKYKILI